MIDLNLSHFFYISLCRGLGKYCVKVSARSEIIVREHAAEYYGKLWCSVYDHVPDGMIVINNDNPVKLGDSYLYE